MIYLVRWVGGRRDGQTERYRFQTADPLVRIGRYRLDAVDRRTVPPVATYVQENPR